MDILINLQMETIELIFTKNSPINVNYIKHHDLIDSVGLCDNLFDIMESLTQELSQNTVNRLKISCDVFTRELNRFICSLDIFSSLKSLIIHCSNIEYNLNDFSVSYPNLLNFEIVCPAFDISLSVLPVNLKTLIIKSDIFNQPLDTLNNKLEILEIHSKKFDHYIELRKLNIKKLTLTCEDFNTTPYSLGTTLIYLNINCDNLVNLVNFPRYSVGLETLIINSKLFNEAICNSHTTLKYLSITSSLYNKISDFRNFKLQKLSINCDVLDQSLNNINLPNNLESLHINSLLFNQPIDNLPNTIKFLTINSLVFNQPINKLPKNLIALSIAGRCFDQNVNSLPENLDSLIIKSILFDQPVDKLPMTLGLLIIDSLKINQDTTKLLENIKTMSLCSISGNKYCKSAKVEYSSEFIPRRYYEMINPDLKNDIN